MTGRYPESIAKFEEVAKIFEKAARRSGDDSPHGPADIYTWLGDAFAGKGDLRGGLKYFQKATAALGTNATPATDDDTRCELATSYLKTGSVLARMGKTSDAFAAYRKALDTANPAAAAEHNDVPLLYVIADAQAGLADVGSSLARQARDPGERSRLTQEARSYRQQSLETLRHIPNPSRISPSGFLTEARP
jgi:tetratricopeptide (TPR) repeat protein